MLFRNGASALARARLRALLVVLALLARARARALVLPATARGTAQSDIIGVYTLHPETTNVARPNACPPNLTVTTFEFQVTAAPPSLPAPDFFNIQIDHRNTQVVGRQCESTGNIIATTSDHPFVGDNATDVLAAWAAAGRRNPAKWVSDDFLDAVAKQSFAVGYDFVERSCRGVRVRPGVAYLWFQPAWNVFLGDLAISGKNKYLILTFARDPWSGCLYLADQVGGEGDFPEGPVSDPSLTTPPGTDPDDDRPQPPTGADPDAAPNGDPATPDGTTDGDPGAPGSTLGATPLPATPAPGGSADPGDDNTIFGSGGDASDGPSQEDPALNDDGQVFNSDPDDEQPEDGPACFPASAVVELHDGTYVPMKNVQLGHRVRVTNSHYSDVFFFSHRANTRRKLHDFIRISTRHHGAITLSPGHYLYVDGRLRPARSASVGSKLVTVRGDTAMATQVERVKMEGLFAPHTLHGDIAVDGFRASTYTTAVHPHLAHYVLLAPVRALYHAGMGRLLNGILDSRVETLRQLIPGGPDTLARFV